jgi:hypothetical protein
VGDWKAHVWEFTRDTKHQQTSVSLLKAALHAANTGLFADLILTRLPLLEKISLVLVEQNDFLNRVTTYSNFREFSIGGYGAVPMHYVAALLTLPKLQTLRFLLEADADVIPLAMVPDRSSSIRFLQISEVEADLTGISMLPAGTLRVLLAKLRRLEHFCWVNMPVCCEEIPAKKTATCFMTQR